MTEKVGDKEIDGDNLLSLASHELRTTLSIIKWYTEMLLDGDCGPLNEEQVKYLKTIEGSNQRAIDLIRSILNVSRLNLGTFSVSPEETDLRFIIKDVFTQYKTKIEEKKLHIEEMYVGAVPGMIPMLNVDKKISLIIIRNLIANAIIFSKEGGKILVKIIEAKQYEEVAGKKLTEDSLVMSVSDTGIGIPKEEQGKVYGELFRGDNVRETDSVGAGLGLFTVSLILSKVGGETWFESEKDKGSTFYVSFPKFGMGRKVGRTTLD